MPAMGGYKYTGLCLADLAAYIILSACSSRSAFSPALTEMQQYQYYNLIDPGIVRNGDHCSSQALSKLPDARQLLHAVVSGIRIVKNITTAPKDWYDRVYDSFEIYNSLMHDNCTPIDRRHHEQLKIIVAWPSHADIMARTFNI